MVDVAVIGAGHWGKNLVRNFASKPGAELKYVCDLSEEICRTMASLYSQAELVGDLGDIPADDKKPRSDGTDGLRVVNVLEADNEFLTRGGEPIKL